MKARMFSGVKEQLAASRPAAADAAGGAQCAEVLQMPRKLGGQDLSAGEAHRVAAQISLGKKCILYRHGNDIGERAGAIDELSTMLKRDRMRGGNSKVPFDMRVCNCIAAAALDELAFDRCAVCLGRGQVPDHGVEALEGRQPMKQCERCKGAKRLRWDEDQRIATLARAWVAAFHTTEDPAAAVAIISRTLRMDRRLRAFLSAIDFGKNLLLSAERVAVEQAGVMLEFWGVEDIA